MRRNAQAVLLLLIGGMLLKLVVTGSYDRYVRPIHAPLLVLAGVALVAIAGATLWRQMSRSLPVVGETGADEPDAEPEAGRPRAVVRFGAGRREGSALFGGGWAETGTGAPLLRQGLPREDPTWPGVRIDVSDVDARRRAAAAGWAAAAHEGIDSQAPPAESAATQPEEPAVGGEIRPAQPALETGSGSEVAASGPSGTVASRAPGTRIGWLLAVAALAVLVLAPPTLGSASASRGGTLVTTTSDVLPPLPSGDPVPMSLVDYARRAAAGGATLVDRRVQVVGFVVAGPRNEPYLARLVMGCCAAGARPVTVGLVGNLPGILAAGQWLAIVGTFTPESGQDPVNGGPIPYLSVVTVEEVAPPANPYET